MQNPLIIYPIYILVGILSGFLNTVAGGGTLISLPVLIFMGLPGSVANATLRVAIFTQNIFAVGGFHSKGIRLPVPYVFYLAIVSLAGGWIGARMAIEIPDHLFNRILAVIMVLVVMSILFERKLNKGIIVEKMSVKRQIIGVAGFFLLGIYGGFIQAGIGLLVIALLTHLHHFPLVKTNSIKVFAAVVYTASAVITFALAGKIIWEIGFVVAIGHAIGAWFGSRWSVSAGEVWVKRVLFVAVAILVTKLWFWT
jgi:uncharacterized membrane protein YfcA